MPLSAPVLSAAIRASILSKGHGITDNEATTALCDAIAEAVVAHITSAAIVLPVLLVAPPGGGPVVGTGVVT